MCRLRETFEDLRIFRRDEDEPVAKLRKAQVSEVHHVGENLVATPIEELEKLANDREVLAVDDAGNILEDDRFSVRFPLP